MEGLGVAVAVHEPNEPAEVEKTGFIVRPGTTNTITLRGVS